MLETHYGMHSCGLADADNIGGLKFVADQCKIVVRL